MPRNLITERSFTDPQHVLGVRAEIVGWALLVLAALLWMMRGNIIDYAATRRTATVEISLSPRGIATHVQQAFAMAQKSCPVEATLLANTNPAIHGGVYFVVVTADTNEKALAGQAAIAKAMEATQAVLPEDNRQFKVDAGDGRHTAPAPNEAMWRLEVAVTALAVLIAAVAQTGVILGAVKQIGTKPRDLWVRLALPFLFILIPQGGSEDRNRHITSEAVWLFSWSLLWAMLAASIVPALVVVRLARQTKATRNRHSRHA